MKTFVQHIRFSALLLLPAVAALLFSCGKFQSPEGGDDNVQKGDATVQIRISSAPDTKSAKDGDSMVNLRVWMVDKDSKVARYASSTGTAITGSSITIDTDSKQATVTFSDVVRGDYTLYFLANSTALNGYGLNSTIDNNFLKATLALPSGSTCPSYSDTEGMPLSLKKTCSIGPGVNHISAEIVRVCGQINVTLKNRTKDKDIYITGVSLSQRSPSSGYVFQQDDHSSPSTTQSDLASNTALTCIKPVDPDVEGSGEVKMLSCYLFENCSDETNPLELSIKGGLFASGTDVQYVTKSGYEAKGSATNTTINTDSYYFLASASSQRQFLMADKSTTLAIEDVGSDDELFVKDDVKNYLWQFSDTSGSTSLKNVGTGSYVNISVSRNSSSYSSSFSFSPNEQKLSTSTSTGRQFYGTYESFFSSTRYSYLYNNSGSIGVTSPSKSTSSDQNTGWYLREATAFTTQGLIPTPEKTLSHTSKLSYTDSYGIVQPLTKVCRGDKVEVVVNMFYNPLTSSFDFEVVPWTAKTNETTFD